MQIGIRDCHSRGSTLLFATSYRLVFDGERLTRALLECGIPQGSVLKPVLLLLYTVDITAIAQCQGLDAHSYVDVTLVYGRCKPASCAVLINFVTLCINEIEIWTSSNRLKLDTDKTQFIWLGTNQQLTKVCCQTISLGRTIIPMSTEITCSV